MSLLAIDAGADGVTAVVVGDDGGVLAGGRHAFGRRVPEPGRVEHAPEEVWRAALEATRAVLARVDPASLRGLGLSDAHDTLVLWDRETLGAPRPAIAADDRRTGAARMDHRLAWLAEHEPRTWALVESGDYAVGGLASYLVARLTRGTWHVTDVGQASRTGLLDLDSGRWSGARCAGAGVPVEALPEPVPSWGVLDRTDARSFCDLDVPIAGLAGAGTATLLGRGGVLEGDAAYAAGDGTLLVLAGGAARPAAGLRPTLAWRAPDGTLTRALTASLAADDVAPVLAGLPGPTRLRGGSNDDHDAARGAAYLAGLGTGVWATPSALPGSRRPG